MNKSREQEQDVQEEEMSMFFFQHIQSLRATRASVNNTLQTFL